MTDVGRLGCGESQLESTGVRSLHSPTYSVRSLSGVRGLRGQSSDSPQTKFRLFLAEAEAKLENPSLSLVLGQLGL